MLKLGISCNALAHSGGFERYVRDLLSGFASMGIKPVLFARSIDHSLKEASLAELHEVSVKGIPNKLRDLWFSRQLKQHKATTQLDCLIGCNRVSSADIAVCGGTHLGYLQAIGRNASWTDKLQIALEEKHYANAKIVVAHSQLMAQELQVLYGISPQKIHQLYPPVDAAQFVVVNDDIRQQLRRQWQIDDALCTFVFASTSHERKGYPLLEAFFADTALPVQLLVAGRPIPRAHPNIRYLGYVQNMADLYRAADYTIMASRYEPFGLAAIESALCGTPLCMPEDLGAAEVLSDEAKILFERTHESLALAIENAMAEKITKRVMLMQNIDTVLSYNSTIQHHCSVLLDIAKNLGAVVSES
jgi:glycosyltransferase involved in cell wall biosynthesis